MPKAKTAKKAPKIDAAPSFKFVAPKAAKVAKGAEPTAEVLAKVHALSVAGVLPATESGEGFDIAEVMRLYAKYGPLIEKLLPFIKGLFKKDKPVVVAPPASEVDPNDEPVRVPPPPMARTPERLEAKVFWVSRKNTPSKAGGGRYLISDEAKRRIVAGGDPLQAGDRVCFDVSPYDQLGVKYESEKPFVLEHVVGGVGELQQQEENDFTPVLLAPWEGPSGQPGFQGTLTYQARGGGLESNAISLRVRPWRA